MDCFSKFLKSCTLCSIALWMLFSLALSTSRFVKQHLHGGPPDSLDAEALKKEVEELRQKNKDLEEQVAQLQAAVSRHTVVRQNSANIIRFLCHNGFCDTL